MGFSFEIMLVWVGAYWLGAVPFALVVARVARLPDPRTYGSGNVGATNVARGGSRMAAIITLFADGGKGAAAVGGAAAVAAGGGGAVEAAGAVAGALAVLGHVTSPFLRFRGGRGVATALAVFLCWDVAVGMAALGVWGAVFWGCRYSSVASLVAVGVAVAGFGFFGSVYVFAAGAVVGGVVAVRHAENLRRLWRGEEGGF